MGRRRGWKRSVRSPSIKAITERNRAAGEASAINSERRAAERGAAKRRRAMTPEERADEERRLAIEARHAAAQERRRDARLAARPEPEPVPPEPRPSQPKVGRSAIDDVFAAARERQRRT